MDMSYINASLGSLQSALSTSMLRQAMGQTAEAVEALLEGMPQVPQLARPAGSMDILV